MRDGPVFAGGMRDERKFKGGMRDCKESAGSGKLVIFVPRRGNSCLFRAGNGMLYSLLFRHFQRASEFLILISKINLRSDHCLIFN